MSEPPETSVSLLIRLRDPRDTSAWAEFTDIYGPLVRGLARSRGLQEADAEDIAQEVFGAVSAAIERYDPDPARGSFRGWLFTIARNLAINALARGRLRGSGDSAVARLLAEQPAPAPEESVQFEAEYRGRLFRWAAEQVRGGFTDAAWRAFWLAGVEGRPAGEVAEELGISVGTVYNCKSRAMARLRRKIEEVEGRQKDDQGGGRTMKSRRSVCDASRLRRLLEDRLPAGEEASLNRHLDECASCRREIERQAAGDAWWEDLNRYLGPNATTPGRAEDEAPLPPGYLDPPDDPNHLGRLGPYAVTEIVGRGGMGVVLRAFDPALVRTVALKILTPHLATSGPARRRFAREARAAAAVVHDNVIAIHAVDEFRGLPYLVMQYVPGGSLQHRIDRDGPLGAKEVLRIGIQAARGLAAAHAQGLVHRDVKPSNILLEEGVERVRITDFGLARAVDDASLTRSGEVAGTPLYMAPEQARGEAVDHRSDLFSLGSVLYAACCGHPPFRADSALAVLRRVADERPRPVREVNPEVPARLAAIIGRLHGRGPSDRYQSAADVAGDLEQLLISLQQPCESTGDRGRSAPAMTGGPRHRMLRPAVGTVLALAVGFGIAQSLGFPGALVGHPQGKGSRAPGVGGWGTPAGPQGGTLVVNISDPRARVLIDDDPETIHGVAQHTIPLAPGSHRVRLVRRGAAGSDMSIEVESGAVHAVDVSADEISLVEGSSLLINLSDAATRVRVDDRRKSYSGIAQHAVALEPGRHCLTISRPGEPDRVEWVVIPRRGMRDVTIEPR